MVFFREVMGVMFKDGFDIDRMMQFLIPRLELVHGTPSNEKGIEDIFRRWRRVASLTENNVVGHERLNFSQRCASELSYPNIAQIPAPIYDVSSYTSPTTIANQFL